MAKYVIRVELKGDSSRERYDNLHKRMASLGFGLEAPWTSNGIQRFFAMPHATYYGVTATNVNALRDAVKSQVEQVQASYVIFVGEITGWAGSSS